MTTIHHVSRPANKAQRMLGTLLYVLEEKRGYAAAGIGLIAAAILVLVRVMNGQLSRDFFEILGYLITWTTYVFIGTYILLSIPEVISAFRTEAPSALIKSALFIPAGLLVSWLAADRIGYPIFKWIVHDVMKEITTGQLERYHALCLTAAQTVGILSILYFCGRTGSLKQWPKALVITALVSVPASLIPRIGTCIIFGISAFLLVGIFLKLGGGAGSTGSTDTSYSFCQESAPADNYHQHQELVNQIHRAGGPRGLSPDEYEMYKEAVRNGEFSGRELEYMAEGMRSNNMDHRYTRSDEQVMEDAENLWK